MGFRFKNKNMFFQTLTAKHLFLKIEYPKLTNVINEIIENYVCEKQVSITQECISQTNVKFNVQNIR